MVEDSKATLFEAVGTPNDVKPVECVWAVLAELHKGDGDVAGSAGNDLILGGTGGQTLWGGQGDDCMLGGGGDDVLDGGPGEDVCIGGPGEDTFFDCETIIQGTPSPTH